MKNNFVSVIIVNWNGRKWLDKCITSLLNQTYKDFEIILVDNASSDGSVEFIQNQFPSIRIIRNNVNLGLPKANNIGIKKALGEFLLLINTDTWIERNFIEKLLDFYRKNDLVVISPIERGYDKIKYFFSNYTIDLTGSPAYFSPFRKDKLFFMSVCYLCTKKDYLETLGFDENHFAYYEDVDWFWRMSLLGKKFGYAKDVYVYHAGAGATGKGIKYKVFLWRNQNALQTLLKNYSLSTLFIILPLYFVQNLFEILFFLILMRFDIAYSYIEGWMFNIRNLKKILKKRRWIQKRRIVSDWEIIKKMYWGPAKLRMFLNYRK